MDKFKKMVKILNRTEDYIMLVFFLFIFLIGLFSLYDSYMVYYGATENLEKYKPGYESEVPDKPIVGTMAAWITMDDTPIDYPIMHGKTNEDYLNTNPFGEYALSGSIFLDFRNKSDFSDDYSLIYGHHMENHAMFGALDLYLDQKYFNEHLTGSLTLNNSNISFKLTAFAVSESDATNDILFAPTMYSKSDILSYITENHTYINKNVIDSFSDQRIVALSTCKYPATSERTLVFCFLSVE